MSLHCPACDDIELSLLKRCKTESQHAKKALADADFDGFLEIAQKTIDAYQSVLDALGPEPPEGFRSEATSALYAKTTKRKASMLEEYELQKHLGERVKDRHVFWSSVFECLKTCTTVKLKEAIDADMKIRKTYRNMAHKLRKSFTLSGEAVVIVPSFSDDPDTELKDKAAVRHIIKKRHISTRERTLIIRWIQGLLICDHDEGDDVISVDVNMV